MQTDIQPDALLDDIRAAKFLGVAPKTLPVWRSTRRVEIPYIKIGRCVRYRLSDLQRFVEAKTIGVAQS
ncbi:helix-turn-helix domain-containing protein [Variovorax sp. OV329]|uniref:helix-turn-helix domain-containing protein n=1 Tax=Variovorax sp. OV329 TaxID=1882825 RepID=UPI0020C8B745|nr:helix-turn-helix domain-containing protein [Variovorax sp. OV329]